MAIRTSCRGAVPTCPVPRERSTSSVVEIMHCKYIIYEVYVQLHANATVDEQTLNEMSPSTSAKF